MLGLYEITFIDKHGDMRHAEVEAWDMEDALSTFYAAGNKALIEVETIAVNV
jgi:hypothetical protein